jgi:starvation-inducible DNA-binding protein
MPRHNRIAHLTKPDGAGATARASTRASSGGAAGVSGAADAAGTAVAPHRTKNHLSEETRRFAIPTLTVHLANALDLFSQCKQAHWNVKGPSFYSLHLLFDEAAKEVSEWVDLLAERVVQLGGVARGTVRMSAAASELDEYPLELTDGLAHADALSTALAAFGNHVRRDIDRLADAGDADSADILTEVSRGVDKLVWFVEAHTQA